MLDPYQVNQVAANLGKFVCESNFVFFYNTSEMGDGKFTKRDYSLVFSNISFSPASYSCLKA